MTYRLPNDAQPLHYNLKFEPNVKSAGKFSFDGEAEIILQVQNFTKTLTMHSSNLKVHISETKLFKGNKSTKPKWHIFKEEPHFLILEFSEKLQPGRYRLLIKYTGIINEDESKGIVYAPYSNKGTREKGYTIATHFEPTFARQAFPSWDEPGFKATFNISVKYFSNYTALSNMPVEEIIYTTDGMKLTSFKKTPLMSTYLVAFAVSTFVNISNSQRNLSLWVREGIANSVDLALAVSKKALPFFEEYTNISYSLPKLDIIAIPGFEMRAMENYGLIVIEETFVLKNADPQSFPSMETTEIIVHEIAHQWFGNLVTPAWWSDLWITEGISTYFGNYFQSKVTHFSKAMEYFVVSKALGAFRRDECDSSLSLFREINTEAEAYFLTETVHSKGAAMIHMLRSLISEKVFQTGLREMLKQFKFKTISTNDFWRIMQNSLKNSDVPNFNIKRTMDPFLSQVGFPVINVKQNGKTGGIRLSQTCPNCLQNKNVQQESKWWIPINFTTGKTLDFSSTLATRWMDPKTNSTFIGDVDADDWIILNIQGSGYYRVNYDKENWRKLADYLNSDNFANVHRLNRAKLLDDAFWSYNNNKMGKKLFEYLLSYLKQELDYAPWWVANYILLSLSGQMDDKSFKELVLPVITALSKKMGGKEKENKDYFNKTTRSIILHWKRYIIDDSGRRSKNNKTDRKWWIPINFASSGDLNFFSTVATHWLNPHGDELIIEGINPNDWVIFNKHGSGSYGVNYDKENWGTISDYLNSENYSNIHFLNPARLLRDTTWFYRKKRLDSNFLIYLASYLKRDNHVILWLQFENGLLYLSFNADPTNFKNFALSLVDTLLFKTNFDKKENDEILVKLLLKKATTLREKL